MICFWSAVLPQLCYRYMLSSAIVKKQFYTIFMGQFLHLQSHLQKFKTAILSVNQWYWKLWLKLTIIVSINMWKSEGKQRNIWPKKEKQPSTNFFQCEDKVNISCIVLEAHINMHWSFILPFIQVNFWFKEPYVHYNCT